jgi:hypothetical protein
MCPVTCQPRLGLRANIGSGDCDPEKPMPQTFNALIPKRRYFGCMALISFPNILDRQSVYDRIYRPLGSLLRSGR